MKLIRRQITPALSQVIAQVAQDVNQLETLAVARSELRDFLFRATAEVLQVRETDPGPEFSDAASHEIGVFIQLCGIPERASLPRPAEPFEIERLAAINLFQDVSHGPLVVGHKLLKPFKQRRKLPNQVSLRTILLQGRERFRQAHRRGSLRLSLNCPGKINKPALAKLDRRLWRIGYRVSRAGQQIGERQWIAQRLWKN